MLFIEATTAQLLVGLPANNSDWTGSIPMIPTKNPKLFYSSIFPENVAAEQARRAAEMRSATQTFKANKLGSKKEARETALAILKASKDDPKVHTRLAHRLMSDAELRNSMRHAISAAPTDKELRVEAKRLGILPGQKDIVTKQQAQQEAAVASLDKAALSGIEQLPTVSDTRARKANLTSLETRGQIATLVLGAVVLEEYRDGIARTGKREKDLIRDAGLDQRVEHQIANIEAVLVDARNEIYPELAAEKFELAASLAADTPAAGSINPEPVEAVRAEVKAETAAEAAEAEQAANAGSADIAKDQEDGKERPSALNKMLNAMLDAAEAVAAVELALNPAKSLTPEGVVTGAGLELGRALVN